MWPFKKRKQVANTIDAVSEIMNDAQQFNDDIDIIVKYGEILENINVFEVKAKDLPYSIEKIEQAINRCLKSPRVPEQMKQAAQIGQQYLHFFK